MFLRQVLELSPSGAVQTWIPRLLELVLTAVNEEWYKIIAEGVRVLGGIIVALRPRDTSTDMFVDASRGMPLETIVPRIYEALRPRLEALDIDQEIKECSILTMGSLFAHMGDLLPAQLPVVLALLRRRLDNEITRTATLRAIGMIATSPLALNLTPFLRESIVEIAQFLRQQNRSLKQTTLLTLDALVGAHTAALTTELAAALLREVAALVTDADLQLAHLALKTAANLFANFPAAAPALLVEVYPRAVSLATSSLLQGQAQTSLVLLLQNLVIVGPERMAFSDLFDTLYFQSKSSELPKQSVSTLSKCIAGICMATTGEARDASVSSFSADLSGADDKRRQLALLCLGEMGRRSDLASKTNLKDLVLSCFESASEEIKSAAAFALGNLAVGNMPAFLPVVLQPAHSTKNQYLLLAALKEVIVVHASSGLSFEVYLEQVLPGLLGINDLLSDIVICDMPLIHHTTCVALGARAFREMRQRGGGCAQYGGRVLGSSHGHAQPQLGSYPAVHGRIIGLDGGGGGRSAHPVDHCGLPALLHVRAPSRGRPRIRRAGPDTHTVPSADDLARRS